MRYLYTVLMRLLTPYFFMRLYWKGRKNPGYRQRMAERLMWASCPAGRVDVWIHAVSLGEVIAATPLIEALLKKPITLLVTTMTPTGSARVQQAFGERVKHQYIPYDLPGAMTRFLTHYQPRVGLMMETELWPNMIACAQRCAVPLVLINGRLSEHSYRGYARLKRLFSPLLKTFSAILVQTPADRERFLRLGALPETVHLMGNMKFDVALDRQPLGRFEQLKQAWGAERPVLILASTHADEEQQVLLQLKAFQQVFSNGLLLIAPRHPERFSEVYQACIKQGIQVARGSQIAQITPAVEIVILDAMGELMQAYQCADYAFVGGSFVPVGGHNVLEPISLGVPVFSGPHVHNFQAICETLLAADALQLVSSAADLVKQLAILASNPTAKRQQAENAMQVLMQHRGSVERCLGHLEPFGI